MIGKIAARQHGVVTRPQLIAAGVPAHVIAYRVKKGRLHGLHRGVYRLGPLTDRCEREAAAVLACGKTAVLSHHSAAALWQPAPRLPHDGPVEVSIRGGPRVRGSAVRVHRVESLDADETTVLDGIPITTVARTIVDLAARVGEAELEQMVARAEREGLMDREQLMRLIARRERRPGMRKLTEVLSREGGPALTRSEAEPDFSRSSARAACARPA